MVVCWSVTVRELGWWCVGVFGNVFGVCWVFGSWGGGALGDGVLTC